MFRFLFLLVTILLVLTGCSGPVNTFVEPQRSAEMRPVWIGQVPQADEDYFYFRGIRTGAKRLEDGEHDAVQAAVRQILEYLGQEGIVYYAKERDELETRIIDRVKLESSGRVLGARLLELYFEKDLNPGVDGRFDVFALVRYPSKELQAERRRYEQQLKNFFIAAGRRYQQGMEYFSQGRSSAALSYLKDAGLFLDKIPESRYPQLLAEFGGKDIRGEVNSFVASVDRQVNTRQISITMDQDGSTGFSQKMDRRALELDLNVFPMLDGSSEMLTTPKYRMTIDVDYGQIVRQPGNVFNVDAVCKVKLREDKTDNVVYQLSQASVGFGRDQQLASIDAMDRCIGKSVQKMGLLLEEWGYSGR